MIFAPVLDEVAAVMGGTPPDALRADPAKWAYALRDAVELAKPDWIVTHHDSSLEAQAIAAEADDADAVPDACLGAAAGPAAVAELTATLAGIYPGRTLAASVTAPATVAGRLCAHFGVEGEDERLDLLDACSDLLAGYAARLTERGASRIVVWEPDGGGFEQSDRDSACMPILRRLEMAWVPAILCTSGDSGAGGFEYVATRNSPSAALIPPGRFLKAADFAELLQPVAGAEIALTDGPIPRACELSLIREAGERAGAIR